MKKCIDEQLVGFILRNWEDRDNAQEVQDIIQAIVAELKKDYRECQRSRSYREEDEILFEGIISDVQGREFWDKLDYMMHFSFEY